MEKSKDWKTWKKLRGIILQTHKKYPEIALLILNRPKKLNAIDAHMITGICDCLDLLKRSFDCRVLIIAGAGRLFCAGLDLSSMTRMSNVKPQYDWQMFKDPIKKMHQRQHEISSIFVNLRKIPQPVIAAVHGVAVGIGMAMANAADILFAAKNTRFINAYIKVGASGADCGSSFFLPKTLGFHRSNELLYTGRDFSAEEAYEWGYVNRLVENNEDVVNEAVTFAAEMLLTKSPLGLRFTKEAINMSMNGASLDDTISCEDKTQTLAGESADYGEAITAFFEKRTPRYGTR